MKCPKYIKEALRRRTRAAYVFTAADTMIADWLEKNNLLDRVELYDICGGCESYVNPDSSSARILEVIENAL